MPGGLASDITKYTGQYSSTMASERIETAIFLFSFEIDPIRRSNCFFDQQWRAPGVCLAFGNTWRDYGAKNSHRQAVEPHSRRSTQPGRDWPVMPS
jgi:hypothetical protein